MWAIWGGGGYDAGYQIRGLLGPNATTMNGKEQGLVAPGHVRRRKKTLKAKGPIMVGEHGHHPQQTWEAWMVPWF